jgi:FkbM family methyltransferase
MAKPIPVLPVAHPTANTVSALPFVEAGAMRRALKALAAATHCVAARDVRLASWYLRLFRCLKLLPDGRWKQFVLNSLQSNRWPDVALPPSTVNLTTEIRAAITPHVGEFDFAAHVCRRLRYEDQVAAWLAGRSYATVVEIGANVGLHTVLFSKLFPDATVYSFEPSRVAYARLLGNLANNQCANVSAFNCAVASEAGFADFHEPAGHLTNGSFDRSFARRFAEEVRTTKVATMGGLEIQQLCGKSRRLLLKIDVEGAEPTVVRTLRPLIVESLPDMVIEVLPDVVEELNHMECFRAYRLFHLTADGPVEKHAFTFDYDRGRDYALVARRYE